MSSRNRNRIGLAVTALLVIGTICAIRSGHKATVAESGGARTSESPTASPAASTKPLVSHSTQSDQVVSLTPNQVVATVNGVIIRLGDIIPVADTNGARQITLDKATLDYYLKRAVDRDLIFQKAQQQGIGLDDSQQKQLAALQAMRNQPEPGGIARLNDTPASNDLEMQDSEAFMLQTTLMSAQGESPNVTEDQVEAFYTQHESQFGGMSLASIQQNQDMWQQVEVEIRNELAPSIRANYNNQAADFMRNLESQATITTTPLASL